MSDEDAKDLFEELTQDIQTLASRMSSQRWPQSDFNRIKRKRSTWGAVHQALLLKCAEIRKKEKRREHLKSMSFADHFWDVAREELPRELFSRLMDFARERHAMALEEVAAPGALQEA